MNSFAYPQGYLSDLERQYGLPPDLLQKVAATESNYNPDAISPKGAMGVFQFMPATAKELGINPFDPMQSAQGAARYLAQLGQRFGGDWQKAVAAYNWGPGNVEKYGVGRLPAETSSYIKKVMGDTPTSGADIVSKFDSLLAAKTGSAEAPTAAPASAAAPAAGTKNLMAQFDAALKSRTGGDTAPVATSAPTAPMPKQPSPTSAGSSWLTSVLDRVIHSPGAAALGLAAPMTGVAAALDPAYRKQLVAEAVDVAKGATLPYANIASHVPGVSSVVTPVQKWADSASPGGQLVGGALSTALPVGGLVRGIGAATEGLPLAARALAQMAGGAGLGALTSNPGNETLGAVLGGAGGALATPGLLTRGLAAGPQTANDKALVEDALKAGYKLTPSYRTGVPGMLQAAAGPARTDAAQANNALLGQRLQQVLTNEPLNPRTLSGMGNKLMDEFDTATKGMTYTPKPAVAQFVAKRLPALKETLLDVAAAPGQDPTRLAQAKSLLGKLENGSPLDANETRQFLQAMKGIATDQEQFNRYVKPLLTVVEKDIQNTNPKLLSNIQSFNTRYNVYKTLQKSVENDPAFQARNQIDAERLAGAGAKYHSKEIDAANPDTLYGQLGLGRQLGLFPLRNPSERFPAAEAIGAFRQLQGGPGVGSEFGKFALARRLLESTVGRGLRAYYDSPAGQAALAGQRLPDSDLKSILALSALLNGQNALTAPQP